MRRSNRLRWLGAIAIGIMIWLILKPEAMLDGLQMDGVISTLLKQVPVPR